MKKIMLLLALALSITVSGQTNKATNQPAKVIGVWANTFFTWNNNKPSNYLNEKGKLPPCWLKNKVSEAQYDTLAALNMLAYVDYNGFKGYNLDQHAIDLQMKLVAMAIKNITEKPGYMKYAEFNWNSTPEVNAVPYEQKDVKGAKLVKFLVYSSIDGYDAHIMVSGTLARDKATKGYTLNDVSLDGFSLGGAPTTFGGILINEQSKVETNTVSLGKDGKSGKYTLSGTIEFTDPLGNKHAESVHEVITFSL